MPLRARLLASANSGGGWPYYPGNASRIEPTSWALLALAASSPDALVRLGPGADSHIAFLRGRQDGAGLLVDPGSPLANLAWNGFALLALDHAGFGADPMADRLGAGISVAKGVRLPNDPAGPIDQDNQLQAWAWMHDTFSWVEPTAACILALKRRTERRPFAAADRVREAERMLLDRTCPAGGWNYGNRAVLGQDLRAYVPTTALALLALQDRIAEPQVRLSLDWLSRHATSERSAMALALTAICLAIFRLPTDAVIRALRAQIDETDLLDNAHLIAMAQYALTLGDHDARAFRVPRLGSAG